MGEHRNPTGCTTHYIAHNRYMSCGTGGIRGESNFYSPGVASSISSGGHGEQKVMIMPSSAEVQPLCPCLSVFAYVC